MTNGLDGWIRDEISDIKQTIADFKEDRSADLKDIRDSIVVINHELGHLVADVEWLKALWWKFLLAIFLLFAGAVITIVGTFIAKLLI